MRSHDSNIEPIRDKDCFNSFDNFDECWEKIEEFCLNEQTGEFEDCHKEEEEEHSLEEHSENLYVESQHCYARFKEDSLAINLMNPYY